MIYIRSCILQLFILIVKCFMTQLEVQLITTAQILTATNKYKNIFLVLPNSDVEILLTDFKAFNDLAQDRLILMHVPMCLLRTVNGALLVIPRSQLSYWAFC